MSEERERSDVYRNKAEKKRAERVECFMREIAEEQAAAVDSVAVAPQKEEDGAKRKASAYRLLTGAGFDIKTAWDLAARYSPVFFEPTVHKILTERARDLSCEKVNPHEGHRRRLRASIVKGESLDSFSDVELLETLLSFVVPRKDTNVIAHSLLDAHGGSLNAVLHAKREELTAVPSMTEAAAVTVTLMSILGYCNDRPEARIPSRRDALEFFSSLFTGGVVGGTYLAYLDGSFRLVALEKHGERLDAVSAVGGLYKHSAQYLIIGKNDDEIFTRGFNDIDRLRDLIYVLDAMGATFMDYMLFTPLGYYSLGSAMMRGAVEPIFVFTPTVSAAKSKELAERALRGEA